MTFELTRRNLFKLYIDTLNNRSIRNKILNEILLEKNLTQIDKNIIDKLRSSLKIVNDDKNNKYNLDTAKIRFGFNGIKDEKENINRILLILQKKINNEIKKVLISNFDSYIMSLQEISKYINELEKSTLVKTEEEKLEYLKSHAATARDLGIEKISENITDILLANNLPNAMFNYSNAFYYLMGYEFLEKRINQIISGLENTNNNGNLSGYLENRNFYNNKSIDGIKKLFKNTPLGKTEEFYAAYFDLENLRFDLKSIGLSAKKLMFFAFITGFLLSIIYFLIHESVIKKYISLIKIYKKR